MGTPHNPRADCDRDCTEVVSAAHEALPEPKAAAAPTPHPQRLLGLITSALESVGHLS